MPIPIILASGSETRASLLRNAGLAFQSVSPRVDEDAIKTALLVEQAKPRDIADCLAEAKARKVSTKNPEALVIGSDQTLEINGTLLSKPSDRAACKTQLLELSGKVHQLHSAAVIYEGAKPIWCHIGTVRLRMHALSEPFIDGYIDRNWTEIQHSVGGYHLEKEGVRLMSSVQGDFFHVLGLPLTEILNYLVLRGELEI